MKPYSKLAYAYGGALAGLALGIWCAIPMTLAGLFDPTFVNDFHVSLIATVLVTFCVTIAGGTLIALAAQHLTNRPSRALTGACIGFAYGIAISRFAVLPITSREQTDWVLVFMYCVLGTAVGAFARIPLRYRME